MVREENYDVVIVGCGVGGLYTALNLPSEDRILMICKEDIESCDSMLAQGGICVLRDETERLLNRCPRNSWCRWLPETLEKIRVMRLVQQVSPYRVLLQRHLWWQQKNHGMWQVSHWLTDLQACV